MADLTEDLAGLVDSIVRPLVDEPNALEVTAAEAEDGAVVVEIRVAAEDAGKVIGRQGRVIKAIRTLARAAASRSGKLVDVELID
ncbi:KH domain-containing protein [Adlercreutzia sp. R21]|uniref:KH domain-containing protein n=1 Tax=Adlercreutzia wanghongyangiae TaxID=3111451 RepID=UPI002DBDEDC1|nr:KH domain-containing protein [Adlercreutzia sp. R21]MEC4183689.1 KH domain-containing protein [Adlercreutzia sp. R21]